MTTIGKRTKKFRDYLELNQTQLGKELDIKPQSVQRVESDNGNFSIETLIKLMVLFNININWYLTGEGSMFIEQKNTLDIIHRDLKQHIKAQRVIVTKIMSHNNLIPEQGEEIFNIKASHLTDLVTGKKQLDISDVYNFCENADVTSDLLLFNKKD